MSNTTLPYLNPTRSPKLDLILNDALAGGVTGGVGALALRTAGYAGFDAWTAAAHGTVGGAALALPIAALLGAFNPPRSSDSTASKLWAATQNVLISAAGGAVGATIVQAIRHGAAMTAGASAAACATGAAILMASTIVLLAGLYYAHRYDSQNSFTGPTFEM